MASHALRQFESTCQVEIEQGPTFTTECKVILRKDGRVEIPCQIPTKDDLINVNRVLHERHLVFASIVGKDVSQTLTLTPQPSRITGFKIRCRKKVGQQQIKDLFDYSNSTLPFVVLNALRELVGAKVEAVFV